ncbi:MAG: FkbM family methyltransferase [Chitinophagales bacterium]|nr:FkbM family methyltransferase [Chitinophagales bacterium]
MKRIIIKLIDFFAQLVLKRSSIYIFLKDRYFIKNDDHIFLTLYYIKEVLSSNPIIVDIGAANGSFIDATKSVFSNFNLIGYEPLDDFYSILKEKYKDNKNIIIHNAVVSDSFGSTILYKTNNNYSSSLLKPSNIVFQNVTLDKEINVSKRHLDADLRDLTNIDLIKIDVQGAEKLILEQNIDTLKKTKFILLEMSIVEQYSEGVLYYELDEFLRINGFTLINSFFNKFAMPEFDALYCNKLL